MTNRICSVDDCERVARAKGWCQRHYYALRPERCTYAGCTTRKVKQDLCHLHWGYVDSTRRVCPECSQPFVGHPRRKYCGVFCKAQAKRSPLRKAVEAGDSQGIIDAARRCSSVNDDGCWVWGFALTAQGYGVVGQGGRGGLVHRHVAEARAGVPLGKLTVHHKCANRACVNPDHLEAITARENVAEMFERNYYLRRIAELEAEVTRLKGLV